jgi:phosphohistidine phosphatase
VTGSARRLLLLRHAKSSWDDPGLTDHDRPLAPRGRRAAKVIGAYLTAEHPAISLVVCSSAQRTRETLDRLSLRSDPAIEIAPALYEATAGELLARVQRVPDDVDTVLLIGHNPAIQDLATSLAAGGELAGRRFPTGALAVLECRGSWHELEAGGAPLRALVTPRELAR